MAIYKTEDVVKGENAIWPWMSDYRQPTKSGYDFVGWEYNGTTYKPPFSGSPMASPFGPINGNAEVYAIWKKSAETYYDVVWKDGDFPPLPDQYEVEVISDSSIIATEGDEITISANFKKGGTSYTAPYSEIFKRTGNSTYTKIHRGENSNNITYTFPAEYGTTGFMVVMNDSEINSVEDYLDRTWISATISQTGEHTLDTLLEPFETYLKSKGYIEGTIKEKSLTLYGYLEELYNQAETEWNNSDSELFASSTYEELDIFNCHGENNQYDDLGNKAMHMWLIAMQLSELIPDSDETNEIYRANTDDATNNTTELFRIAYDLGNEKGYGKTIPIYGPENNYYTIKSDLMIARLVAGVIYSKNWQNHRETIPQMRQDLGGSTITVVSNPGRADKDWGASSLKFTINQNGTDEDLVNNSTYDATIGYTPNLMNIFPHAPGPYTTEFRAAYGGDGGSNKWTPNSSSQYPFERKFAWKNDDGEDISDNVKELFDLSGDGNRTEGNENNYGNYFVDKHVYDTAVSDYNIMENELIYDAEGYYKPNDEHSENLQDVMDAYIDEEEEAYLFKKDASYTDKFLIVSGSPCSSTDIKDVKITGSGVYNEDVIGRDLSPYDSEETPFMLLIRRAMRAAKDTRHIYGDFEYGRRRPGGGASELSIRYSSTENDCGWRENHGLQPDNPNYCNTASYPSGHTSGGWATAMILTEMFPDRYNEIFKSGYTFGVSREIARAHWHSDVMYARVIATMALPLIHAMEDYNTTYDAANNFINTDELITINLKFVNERGYDVVLDGDVNFCFNNDASCGYYIGWTGAYTRIGHTDLVTGTDVVDNTPTRTFPIAAGGNVTCTLTPHWKVERFDSVTKDSLGSSVIGLRSKKLMPYPDDGLLMQVYIGGDGGSTSTVKFDFDENTVFEEGGTYTIRFV